VSAVDVVTAEVRRSVLDGTLAPGASFSVAQLARQMDISHIPVREALRRLENQGLIELKHARSAVVVPLSVEDLKGIYSLRLMIEPELVARSVSKATEHQIAQMASLIEEFHVDDPEVAWRAHQAFHRALVEPAASAWDLRTLDQLWAAAERYTRLVYDFTYVSSSERSRRARVHLDLLDTFTSGDPDSTREALAAHLASNERELIRRISLPGQL